MNPRSLSFRIAAVALALCLGISYIGYRVWVVLSGPETVTVLQSTSKSDQPYVPLTRDPNDPDPPSIFTDEPDYGDTTDFGGAINFGDVIEPLPQPAANDAESQLPQQPAPQGGR